MFNNSFQETFATDPMKIRYHKEFYLFMVKNKFCHFFQFFFFFGLFDVYDVIVASHGN